MDIGFLIDRLAPLIEKKVAEEYDLFVNSKTEAITLSSSLNEIQKVLEEAEKRRMTDPRVIGWIERLQNVTYEINDALDEWMHMEECDKPDENKKDCMDQQVCLSIANQCFNVKRFYQRRCIALNIRDLNAKIDLLSSEKIKYNLLPVMSDSPDSHLDITTSYVELFDIEAQTTQTKELVLKLLASSEEEADSKIVIFPGQVKDIQIYSLIGLAGVGKTAVAQRVFHNTEVQKEFSLSLWICVSNCSDGVGVCKEILKALNIWPPPNTPDFQTLLHHIRSSFWGKKFFLVLDDVRIEDEAMWNELKACFRYGAAGSRILVSTRNKKVAKVMGHSSRMVSVDPLPDDDCQLLLEYFAFRGREMKNFPKLESIAHSLGGKQCKGMPLAAKTLGLYLNSTDNEDLWNGMLKRKLWQIDEVSKTIFAPLASSYKDLPLALKHCLYTATFLSSYEIEVDELMRIWSVDGYLDFGGANGDIIEIRGQEYVEKLTEHFFFQNCITDQISKRFARIYMHDIVHDFAQYLLTSESKAKKLRHISCEELEEDKHDNLKYARLMILKCCTKLPDQIRSMIHLRYLDLKGTTIEKLPASICYLFNLQTLDLQKCEYLVELPEKIHKLRKNLKCLLLEGTVKLTCLPKGLKSLTSIQTLDQFSVKEDGSTLSYLENLDKLQGSLCVRILKDMTDKEIENAQKAKLTEKVNLSDLTIYFHEQKGTKKVMEALEPPPKLLSLCIDGYAEKELPSWFGKSLHFVKKLEMKSCSGLVHLPALGMLRSLEELKIDTMESLKSVGYEFIETTNTEEEERIRFPKLKILTFRSCVVLTKWKDIKDATLTIMPLLESLSIESCPRLEILPSRLLSSRKPRTFISRCPSLPEIVEEQN